MMPEPEEDMESERKMEVRRESVTWERWEVEGDGVLMKLINPEYVSPCVHHCLACWENKIFPYSPKKTNVGQDKSAQSKSKDCDSEDEYNGTPITDY